MQYIYGAQRALGKPQKQVDPFYRSPAWLAVRRQALQRDGYRCVVCGKDVSSKGDSRVDHIRPRKQFPELALALSNLRTLCADHDNQAHREKGSNAVAGQRVERFIVRGCRPDGAPLDPSHPWRR